MSAGHVTQLVHPVKHEGEYHVRVLMPDGTTQDWLLSARDSVRARANAEANRYLLPVEKATPHSAL